MNSIFKVGSYLNALFVVLFTGLATNEQAYQRWRLCRLCTKYDADQRLCTYCGCSVNPESSGADKYRQKVFFKSEECPIGKWSKITSK